MKTRVLACPSGFDHHPPHGHPEHAGRLEAVLAGAKASGVAIADHAGYAPRSAIERVHVPAHVERVFAASPSSGTVSLDADTHMSPGSLTAALDAAGAAIAAVDLALSGDAEAVFVAARPPGHHAEPDRAMGFCLFNSVAIGAAHALDAGLERVAIVDIDVHHGNGTQAWAETEPRCLFASIHQAWIYPGTGAAHETGRHGNIVNVPFERGTAGEAWMDAFERIVVPRIESFNPQLLVVSAGFDAHADDPLAGLALEDGDYARAGKALADLAGRVSASRLVCLLEGGYDCAALERAVAAFLGALDAA